jgi:hypothetical protein
MEPGDSTPTFLKRSQKDGTEIITVCRFPKSSARMREVVCRCGTPWDAVRARAVRGL